MKLHMVLNKDTQEVVYQAEITPQTLTNIIDGFAKQYYINRKDYKTVTIKQLLKDLIESQPEIKLNVETNYNSKILEKGIEN